MTTHEPDQSRWIHHLLDAGPATLTYPDSISDDDITELVEWLDFVSQTLRARRERRRCRSRLSTP
jgi:hypothetical protein